MVAVTGAIEITGPGDQLIAFLGRHPHLRAAPGTATA
jgi:hypothetical protein